MPDLVKVVSRTVFRDSETKADVFVGDTLEVTKLHADDLKLLGLVEDAPAPKPAAAARAKG
jgi:hypothetical protein